MLAMAMAGGLAGCGGNAAGPAAAPTNNIFVPASTHLNHAQPKLPAIKLWLGAEELDTEVAITLTQISTGMMFRTNMLENEAMLFVFATPRPRSFYMRNCVVPLSIAYIDSQGVILEIAPLQPGVEEGVPSKSEQVQFVLEVKQGWFEQHNIKPGAVLRTERGSLLKTFAGRPALP